MIESQMIARQLLAIILPLTRAIAAELRQTDPSLNSAHLGVLAMLVERPCNLSELADYQGVSLPTMSGSISRLEARGWVQRERSTDDRRIVIIQLTPLGEQKLAEMHEQVEAYIGRLLESTSPTERETLAEGLNVLQNLFKII